MGEEAGYRSDSAMSRIANIFMIAFLTCMEITVIFPGTAKYLIPPVVFVLFGVTWYESYKMAGRLKKIWKGEASFWSMRRSLGPLDYAAYASFLLTAALVGIEFLLKG